MIENLQKIVEKKFIFEKENDCYKDYLSYLNWIKDEVEEVKAEIKENNSVYLEDEIWDIFWNLLSFIKRLKSEGKIDSLENILTRAEKKYFERIEAISKWNPEEKSQNWQKIKKIQKEELEKEHKEKYLFW